MRTVNANGIQWIVLWVGFRSFALTFYSGVIFPPKEKRTCKGCYYSRWCKAEMNFQKNFSLINEPLRLKNSFEKPCIIFHNSPLMHCSFFFRGKNWVGLRCVFARCGLPWCALPCPDGMAVRHSLVAWLRGTASGSWAACFALAPCVRKCLQVCKINTR